MDTIPIHQTAVLWTGLAWRTAQVEFREARCRVVGLPDSPGLYKVSWVDAEAWKRVQKKRRVAASKRLIESPHLHFDDLLLPVALTIGRSTKLNKRFQQHFSDNKNNNRIFSRLEHILPGQNVHELAASALKIEWVQVASWIDRCLLEAYGKATLRPILDIDAEH